MVGQDERTSAECPSRPRGFDSELCGGAVYGLGLIGALVWYWQHAEGGGEQAFSVLKAMVWPAFLVYDALESVHR